MLKKLSDWVVKEAVEQSQSYQTYEAREKFADSFLDLSKVLFGAALLALVAQVSLVDTASSYAYVGIGISTVFGELARRAGVSICDAAVLARQAKEGGE